MRLEDGQLSEELRQGRGGFLGTRRAVAGLAVFSTAVLGGIALYQLGITRHLPDPPFPGFDSDKVNGSPEAYSHLAVPDGLLGMLSYSATACLAGMGGREREKSARWIPLAMGAKALLDAAMAAKLTRDEISKFHAFSFGSLLVAAATFTALPLALREAAHALRTA
jgi:hypothetical protein